MTEKNPTPKYVSKKQQTRIDRENMRRRWLTIGIISIAVLVIGLIAFGIINEYVLKQNRAVARVDGKSITVADFETQVRFTRFNYVQNAIQIVQFAQAYGLDTSFYESYLTQIETALANGESLASTVLDEMVDTIIVEKEANALGIVVSDEEIDQRVEEFFQYYKNGTPTPTVTVTPFVTSTLNPIQLTLTAPTSTPKPTATTAGTEPSATATAAPTATQVPPTATTGPTSTPDLTATAAPTATALPTSTPYTYDGFTSQMKSYLEGVDEYNFTRSDLRNLMKAQLYRDRLLAEITKDLKPEQDQVWARHILVATEEEALAALEQLKNGTDWCELASQISTDTSNNQTCGDLNWFGPGGMVTEFEVAAYNTPVGEISQPIQTTFGFHLIQVLGHEARPLSQSEFEQVKEDAFTDWLTQKKADHTIEKYDDVWKSVVPIDPTLPAGLY